MIALVWSYSKYGSISKMYLIGESKYLTLNSISLKFTRETISKSPVVVPRMAGYIF